MNFSTIFSLSGNCQEGSVVVQIFDSMSVKITPYLCSGNETRWARPSVRHRSGGFYLRKQIARSVFVGKKFRKLHCLLSKNSSCSGLIPEDVFSQVENFLNIQVMDMNVEAGKSGKREKKKRGRKPKANPQVYRYCFRMNKTDYERFLQMYKRSGMKSYSAFIVDCVLNCKPKIVEINKSVIDFVILLSSFFAQFRAIANNYNQVNSVVYSNVKAEIAQQMMVNLVKATIEFKTTAQKIEEHVIKLRALC
ncbi:MAG: hypothetical protein FWD60_11695 [Candidatus Azobacteroides sp.]|nr:hypothetical protein [Candidatus Azobacteroides sp.]